MLQTETPNSLTDISDMRRTVRNSDIRFQTTQSERLEWGPVLPGDVIVRIGETRET